MLRFLALSVALQGHALSLNGLGQGLVVPSTPALVAGAKFTVEAWVKPEFRQSTGPFQFIVSKNYGGGYALLLVGSGDDYRFQYEGGAVIAYGMKASVLKGKWWHLAGVSDGSTATLYVNGVKVVQDTQTGPIPARDVDLRIGTSLWNSFCGQIDEVRLWNVARSQEEIAADMRNHLTGKEPGLMAYWDFERVRGKTVYDRTHHTKPGQLVGKTKIAKCAPFNP